MAKSSVKLDLSTENIKAQKYAVDRNLRRINNPLAYEVRFLQMYIRRIHRCLALDPLYISAKDYTELLEVHTKKVLELQKKGWPNSDKRNDKEEMEGEVLVDTAEGTRKAGLPRVDTDIYA